MEIPKDVHNAVEAARDRFKNIEGFSDKDIDIAMGVICDLLMSFHLNKFPVSDKRFHVTLRILADVLELSFRRQNG